jgi:hypothetical protein
MERTGALTLSDTITVILPSAVAPENWLFLWLKAMATFAFHLARVVAGETRIRATNCCITGGVEILFLSLIGAAWAGSALPDR